MVLILKYVSLAMFGYPGISSGNANVLRVVLRGSAYLLNQILKTKTLVKDNSGFALETFSLFK